MIFAAGAVFGILFWGGFHTVIEVTNTLEFCTSCHEMEQVFEEYKQSAHYKNASGVRATCPDCRFTAQTDARSQELEPQDF